MRSLKCCLGADSTVEGDSLVDRGARPKREKGNAGKAKQVSGQTWDYIIVGGGAAGCALANRLTAAEKKVLVLEAGGENYKATEMKIPAGVLKLFQSEYDWHFQTSNEAAINNRSVYLCRGKVLGGSSVTNVLLYNRGDANDYNVWDTEFGCKGWKADEVLPDFIRHENDRTGSTSTKHHGTSGELCVEHVRYQNPMSRAFLEACEQAGLPSNPDFNDWSRKQEGAGRFSVMTNKGERCDCASAFMKPALDDKRRKLEVLTGAAVRKVNINENGAATGVKFALVDGNTHTVNLAQGGEVLLAGGAIHSPQLLMLSGVGPRDHLEKMGIDVVSDIPAVGSNLQDHPAAVLSYQCPDSQKGVSMSSKLRIPGTTKPNPLRVFQWLFTGTGPMASVGCDHGGFFRTPAAASSSADLQMRFLATRSVTADGMQSVTEFRDRTSHPDGFSFQCLAARPHSSGRVLLSSPDPDDKPIIQGNYLKDSRDVATIREGLKLGRKLAHQQAFSKYIGEEVFPGREVQSDAELDNYIKSTVHTGNALVGTCRMGQPNDPLAVVDTELKVKGVSGLRVIDSSVMPKLPGGQIVASTLMVVERGADMLLRK